jgi:hypothetical protein
LSQQIDEPPGAGGRVKSPQDLAGGLALIAIGALTIFLAWDLPRGTLSNMGPGMLPTGLAVILAGLGAVLVFDALMEEGPRLEPWSYRHLLIILGAVVAFGLTVRGFTVAGITLPALGLAAAGPLAVIISALASERMTVAIWIEAILFGVFMTLFCIGLFKFALGLPIPVAPWYLGY